MSKATFNPGANQFDIESFQGPNGNIFAAALRTPGILGEYQIAVASGLTTLIAGAGPVFSFRWSPTVVTQLAIIKRIRARMQVITGFTAQQEAGMDAIFARAFTASDSGGTAVTLTTNNAKKRTSHGTSLVADARIATTAALTAGTRVLDAQPFLASNVLALAAGAAVPNPFCEMEFRCSDIELPIILAKDEGFLIRNGSVAQGTAGTVRFTVEILWNEAALFTE